MGWYERGKRATGTDRSSLRELQGRPACITAAQRIGCPMPRCSRDSSSGLRRGFDGIWRRGGVHGFSRLRFMMHLENESSVASASLAEAIAPVVGALFPERDTRLL